MTLREELDALESQREAIDKAIADVYARSLALPADEKICTDTLAEMLSEVRPRNTSYPWSVSGLVWAEHVGFTWYRKSPVLVRVRPCGDEKTYLGVYVGDIPVGATASYKAESGLVEIGIPQYGNPAILVPTLGRMVLGMESWWSPIKSENDFASITDETIDNSAMMKLFRAMVS